MVAPKRFVSNVIGARDRPVVREAIAVAAGESAPGCGVFSNIMMSISGGPVLDAYNSGLGPYSSTNSGRSAPWGR